jgi:hypothetical protein
MAFSDHAAGKTGWFDGWRRRMIAVRQTTDDRNGDNE